MSKWLYFMMMLASLVSCYEGFDNYQNGPTPTQAPIPPGPKPIAYILYRPIQLDANAVKDSLCFPKTGIRDFKSTEWSMRTQRNIEKLAEIADVVVLKGISITKDDCSRMDAVRNAAADPKPWGTDTAPKADGTDRTFVELIGSYWDDEPRRSPPTSVSDKDWSAWKTLKSQGLDTKSLRYFAISNPSNGYFTEWEATTTAPKLHATAIDNVDPTQSGIAARDRITADDAKNLATFVLGNAQ